MQLSTLLSRDRNRSGSSRDLDTSCSLGELALFVVPLDILQVLPNAYIGLGGLWVESPDTASDRDWILDSDLGFHKHIIRQEVLESIVSLAPSQLRS